MDHCFSVSHFNFKLSFHQEMNQFSSINFVMSIEIVSAFVVWKWGWGGSGALNYNDLLLLYECVG